MHLPVRRPGFSLLELLVVIAVIAVLIGILLPALGNARRQGRTAICTSNYHQLGSATGTYQADYQDRIWAFTWRGNRELPLQPGSPLPTVVARDVDAASVQAVDIIRRRAERPDLLMITGWIPHVYYTHLVVQDYLAARLPERMVVCPDDPHRLSWQIQPMTRFDQNFWAPFQPAGGPNGQKRWPYSSTYQVVPPTYDRSTKPSARIYQDMGSTAGMYWLPADSVLGGARLADVENPSLKVHMMDEEMRHEGKNAEHYGTSMARQPLLMFDGSVRNVKNTDANDGWQPQKPGDPLPTVMLYVQGSSIWKAPTSNGEQSEIVKGMFRWTRGGLKGIDFAGAEIDTGQLP